MRPVIAVSGMPGSGSTTIAKGIAKRMNLDYYSPGEDFKSYSKIKRETEAALDVWMTLGKNKEFHQKNFDDEQVRRAKKGGIVICGKLSIHMLDGIADLKIWIDCDLAVRAKRTSERDGMPYEKALEEIKRREAEEREGWKRIYGFDYFEQKELADFVLENSCISESQALDKVMEFIDSRI
jgi:cytidylate kinase